MSVDCEEDEKGLQLQVESHGVWEYQQCSWRISSPMYMEVRRTDEFKVVENIRQCGVCWSCVEYCVQGRLQLDYELYCVYIGCGVVP